MTKNNYCFPVKFWQEEDAFLLTMLTEYEEQLLTSRDPRFIGTFRSVTPDVPSKEWRQSESFAKYVHSEGYQNSITLCQLENNSQRNNIVPRKRRMESAGTDSSNSTVNEAANEKRYKYLLDLKAKAHNSYKSHQDAERSYFESKYLK